MGDLSVDMVRRLVKVAGDGVKLLPKEYDILALPVTHAGRVPTHQAILQEVRKLRTDIHCLQISIPRKRQKIEPDLHHRSLSWPRRGRASGCARRTD